MAIGGLESSFASLSLSPRAVSSLAAAAAAAAASSDGALSSQPGAATPPGRPPRASASASPSPSYVSAGIRRVVARSPIDPALSLSASAAALLDEADLSSAPALASRGGAAPPLGSPYTQKRPGDRLPKKKRFFFFQRDSLHKREFPGREGSRRRIRHENTQFLLRLVDQIDPADKRGPAYTYKPLEENKVFLKALSRMNPSDMSRPEYLREPAQHLGYKEKVEQMIQRCKGGDAGALADDVFFSRIDRRLRTILRRSHVPAVLVEQLESELLEFLHKHGLIDTAEALEETLDEIEQAVDSGDEDGSDDINDDGLDADAADDESGSAQEARDALEAQLIWELDNPFGRAVAHALCQYYGLSSHSEGDGPSRCVIVSVQSTAACVIPPVRLTDLL